MKRESLVPTLFKHYLNGGWATSATVGLSVNPSDLDEPVGEYVRADTRQADAAIDAASAAWREWSRANPARRAEALDAIGCELIARKAELGRLIAREQGKTLHAAIEEAALAGQHFRFHAADAMRAPGGYRRDVWRGADIEIDTVSESLGVIGVIATWTSPLATPAASIAAALSAGNCVVFKPSECVPGCAWALADIISRAGLPAGVFNLVLGSGRQVGARIASSAQVQALCFSGSDATVQAILKASAHRHVPMQIETSSPNALIVLDDADLDTAVEVALHAYMDNGQSFAASARLIVERGILPAFTEALTHRLANLNTDHALKKGADYGPLVDDRQFKRALDMLATAQKEGAILLHGGETLARATRGYFMRPALLMARAQTGIARGPVCGPLAFLISADDYGHALQLANELPSAYAAICTTSQKYSRHFRRHGESRALAVNLPTTAMAPHVSAASAPFFTRSRQTYLAA